MNRREVLRMTGAAIAGGAVATASMAAGVATAAREERTLAVRLPKGAPVGSAVMLLKVASGWIVVPTGYCTGVKVET